MAETISSSFSAEADATNTHRMPWVVRLFIISLVIPFFFQLGPVQMSASRFLLTLWIVPGMIMWMQGRAGRVRVTDFALLGVSIWGGLSYFVLHGPALAVEASGIYFIETMGAYLMARCYIRTADDFYAVVKMLFWIVMLLMPFALYETITAHNVLLDLASKVTFSGWDVWKEPRWGLDRVQSVFQHPILFGIFCGGLTALTYYVLGYGKPTMRRWIQTILVTATGFLSLSSGPLTAVVAQVSLISWDIVLRKIRQRWFILCGIVLSMVVAIEIAANRSTPEIFISIFAFNTETAYSRILIWHFGTISVQMHPVFGVGLGEWFRPEWKSSSLDMFWLYPAVINGLPAGILMQLAFFGLFLPVAFKSGLGERSSSFRTGYLICMMGFFLAGWTVHYWKVIYIFFLFLFGAGAWILDGDRREDKNRRTPTNDGAGGKRAGRVPQYTRYKASHLRRPNA